MAEVPPPPVVRRRDYWPSQSERIDALKLCRCPCACPEVGHLRFATATAKTRLTRARLAGCCCGVDCSGAANIYGVREVVLGATPAEDGLPCAVAEEVCDPFTDTRITFNVTITGDGAVDICGYALTFTGSGAQTVGFPFVGGPSAVAARPGAGYAFVQWGGVLSGSTNPISYSFNPVECQNTEYTITALFTPT